jgi:hypothetical protein
MIKIKMIKARIINAWETIRRESTIPRFHGQIPTFRETSLWRTYQKLQITCQRLSNPLGTCLRRDTIVYRIQMLRRRESVLNYTSHPVQTCFHIQVNLSLSNTWVGSSRLIISSSPSRWAETYSLIHVSTSFQNRTKSRSILTHHPTYAIFNLSADAPKFNILSEDPEEVSIKCKVDGHYNPGCWLLRISAQFLQSRFGIR